MAAASLYLLATLIAASAFHQDHQVYIARVIIFNSLLIFMTVKTFAFLLDES